MLATDLLPLESASHEVLAPISKSQMVMEFVEFELRFYILLGVGGSWRCGVICLRDVSRKIQVLHSRW
jgi:hypothetical protein